MRHNAADLLLVILFSLAATAAVALDAPALVRVALTMPLIFVFPGYSVIVALFPECDLDGAARLLIVVTFSLALTACGGLLLHFTGAGLASGSWTLFLTSIVLSASAVAFVRRARRPAATGPSRRLNIRAGQAALVGVGLILTVVTLGVAREGVLGREQAGFTQLWAVPLPTPPDVMQIIQIGIRNEEGVPVRYRLVVFEGNAVVVAWNEINMMSGESWQTIYTLPKGFVTSDKLEIELYRLDEPETVYRRVSTFLTPETPEVPSGDQS
jgi:uncharacterized membrane protein